jgi:ankyrin repeat protein
MAAGGDVDPAVLDAWFAAAGKPDGRRVSKSDAKTLERLLDEHKGALDVNACDARDRGVGKRTALGYAVDHDHASAVALLLRRGADAGRHGADRAGRPLFLAAHYGHADVVRALLAGGARVNEVTGQGALPTALHFAAVKGNAAVVRALLEAGADARVRSRAGATAAELAASEKRTEAVAVFAEFAAGTFESLPSRLPA